MGRTRKENKKLAEFKKLMKEIKDRGLLPHGFAKKIVDKLGLRNTQQVYQVSNSSYYNEAIADEILAMAADNKLNQQIQKAKDILS